MSNDNSTMPATGGALLPFAPPDPDAYAAASESWATATAPLTPARGTPADERPLLGAGDAVAGESEADAVTVIGVPAAASEYQPPDPMSGDAPLGVEAIQGAQALAFECGATDGEFRSIWRACMAHQREHPAGIDGNRLALEARTALASLDRTLGADRADLVVTAADAALARIAATSGRKVAQIVRDAAVRNPLVLSTLGQIGRRLPILTAHRKGR